ncbi:YbaN family protein [Marinibacterium sp. SX1]|uniref:YbaN family protein n=1 Tax=Marinibacterium sp. SX1 TaxID=3388424 RepID=UPI003D181622
MTLGQDGGGGNGGLGRVLWFCLGALSLALGAIGALLPVLPTTPFVILSAFAFGKSSPRVEAWLTGHRTFGPMIADWRAHGAIAPRHKRLACAMMAAAFLLSLALGVPTRVLAIQAICLAGAATYVLTRPSGPR